MEERIPHIRTICELFLTEGQDAAASYACLSYERDHLTPGKMSSVESSTLGNTFSALMEPCDAADLVNELFDWIGVEKTDRKIMVSARSESMIYCISTLHSNALGSYAIHLVDLPDAILRWTALKPGAGAGGIRAADHEAYREGRRRPPTPKAKLEKVEGMTEAMKRTRDAISVAQVWQVRVDEMLTKAGIIDDGRFKPKSAPSENASARQIDVDKMAEKIGVTLRDVSIEDANDGVRECIDDMVEHVVAKFVANQKESDHETNLLSPNVQGPPRSLA